MIDLRELDQYRYPEWEQNVSRGEPFPKRACGCFLIPSPVDGKVLRCLAASGDYWDHVSISREDRCPSWDEMDYLARLFFQEDETAMQLHVPRKDHVNRHPNCLHLWRPWGKNKIPLPPIIMV